MSINTLKTTLFPNYFAFEQSKMFEERELGKIDWGKIAYEMKNTGSSVVPVKKFKPWNAPLYTLISFVLWVFFRETTFIFVTQVVLALLITNWLYLTYYIIFDKGDPIIAYCNSLANFFSLPEKEFMAIKNGENSYNNINEKTMVRQNWTKDRDKMIDELKCEQRHKLDDMLMYIRARTMVEIMSNESAKAIDHFIKCLNNPFFLYTTNGYLKEKMICEYNYNREKIIGSHAHTDFGFCTVSLSTSEGLQVYNKGTWVDLWNDDFINVPIMFGRLMKTVFDNKLTFTPIPAVHKVVLPEYVWERYFVGIFCDPDFENPLYALDGTKICDKYEDLFSKWLEDWIKKSK